MKRNKASPYHHCRLCPRCCGVDREAGQTGYCGETAALRIAFAGIHLGEEPPITGTGGSGTIFITGCNLCCVFCQNFQISNGNMNDQTAKGKVVDCREFAEICLTLQEKGAQNINIVTGSHAAPAIANAIDEARKQGLKIPVVWNSSGYDGEETLNILDEFVDIYLPDLKTLDPAIAARYFNAPDYPERAKEAILKMMTRSSVSCSEPADDQTSESAVTLKTGVMIRHLILPGYLDATREVLSWFSENCRGRALFSLMSQYTPVRATNAKIEIPSRFITEAEYNAVLCMLDEFGIDDGYYQEYITGNEWLPDFNRPNPFSSKLSVPVWSCF